MSDLNTEYIDRPTRSPNNVFTITRTAEHEGPIDTFMIVVTAKRIWKPSSMPAPKTTRYGPVSYPGHACLVSSDSTVCVSD